MPDPLNMISGYKQRFVTQILTIVEQVESPQARHEREVESTNNLLFKVTPVGDTQTVELIFRSRARLWLLELLLNVDIVSDRGGSDCVWPLGGYRLHLLGRPFGAKHGREAETSRMELSGEKVVFASTIPPFMHVQSVSVSCDRVWAPPGHLIPIFASALDVFRIL